MPDRNHHVPPRPNCWSYDLVSFQLARQTDHWLHLSGAPGSHVLLRGPEGETPTRELLQQAANIAAEAQRNAERTIQDADYTAQTKMEAANKWAVDLKASVGTYITNLVNETEYRVAKSLNEVHQLQANINQSSLEGNNSRNVRSSQNAVTAAQKKRN